MKENIYNDPVFFEKYSRMNRSQNGLSGAGEWPELKKLLPDFSEKKVLDLGCGYGWHCIYAAENGASEVIGIDLSERMLETAREKALFGNVSYRCAAIEDADFCEGYFDVVISSLAMHYIKDFDAVAKKVFRFLKPGGVFIFSCEHPVFTAEGSQDWSYNPDGSIAHFPVDNYYYEGRRTATFLGQKMTKYHRTLTCYIMGMINCGFGIKAVVEPPPPQDMMDLPGMKDEMRRPMMLIVKGEKPLRHE